MSVLTLHSLKRIAYAAVPVYALLAFWHDPSGSAEACRGFVGDVGQFFSDVIDKGVEFVQGLG